MMTKDGKAIRFGPYALHGETISVGDWEEAWRKLGLAVRNEMGDDTGKWANISISHEGTICDVHFCMANSIAEGI